MVDIVVEQCVVQDVPSLLANFGGHEAVRQGAVEGVASLPKRRHVDLNAAKIPIRQSIRRPVSVMVIFIPMGVWQWNDSHEPHDKSSYLLCGSVDPDQHVLAMRFQRHA